MKCFTHHKRDAEAVCASCRRGLCAECAQSVGSVAACAECVEEVRKSLELESPEKLLAKIRELRQPGPVSLLIGIVALEWLMLAMLILHTRDMMPALLVALFLLFGLGQLLAGTGRSR